MKTRNGSYPSPSDGIIFSIRPSIQKRKLSSASAAEKPRKISRTSCGKQQHSCSPFDSLHDDLLISIIISVGSTASSPADLINTMLTCRRFCAAATQSQVLANASIAAMAVKSSVWSDGASRFLRKCAEAGNIEACYTLGMIRFYCLHNRGGGASLMAKAAMASHAAALHSLAVIQFNGSGGSRKDKDLKAGVALCARAASLGHVDAMRELGHCLQDGYGVSQNIVKGRGLLLEANTREAAAAVAQSPRRFMEAALQIAANTGAVACLHHHLHFYCAAAQGKASTPLSSKPSSQPQQQEQQQQPQPQQQQQEQIQSCISRLSSAVSESVYTLLQGRGCSLLSDFGCNVPPPKLHVANRFLVDWFTKKQPAGGLRLCSHANCGRPETRRHEFRRCSACGCVNYCSRACQALDWKIRHKHDCTPVADWGDREGNGGDHDDDDDDDEDEQQQQQQQEEQQLLQQQEDQEDFDEMMGQS